MIGQHEELIVRELELGTGAAIKVAVDQRGLRAGMQIWFGDLGPRNGPVAEMRPHGLKSHKVQLSFGNFSGAVINQIKMATDEDRHLARALVASMKSNAKIEVQGQSLEDWTVHDGKFRMDAQMRHEMRSDTELMIETTCREVVVPMMGAMAELIGYDVVEEEEADEEPCVEGAIRTSVVNRRERNPRNRLLCIRLHGEICAACGLDPYERYGKYGTIIEVHHLEPLSNLATPKPYDPSTDLVPLCPNCHRVAHSRRPLPWSISEVRSMLGMTDD